MKHPTSLAILCILCNVWLVVWGNDVAVTPGPKYAKLGENVTFNCRYTRSSGFKVGAVEWLFKGSHIMKQTWDLDSTTPLKPRWFDRYNADPTKGKYNGPATGVASDQLSDDVGLTVYRFEDADYGEYACIVEFESTSDLVFKTGSVKVEKNVPPSKPVVTYTGGTLSLLEGDVVTLTCKGNIGSPRGQLSLRQCWKSQCDQISQATPMVIIKNNTDDGSADAMISYTHAFTSVDNNIVFRCEVGRDSISAGETFEPSEELQFRVEVPVPVDNVNMIAKSVNGETKTESQSFEKGQSVWLQCDVSAYPPADIKWYKGTEEVGDKITYTIENATPEHSGTYTCVATNYINGTKYEGRQDVTVEIAEAGTNAGMIAGIVIAVIVVIGVVAGVLVYIFVFRRRQGGASGKSKDTESGKDAELDGEKPKDEVNEEKKQPAGVEAGQENLKMEDTGGESNLNYAELDLRMRDEAPSEKPKPAEDQVEYAVIRKPEGTSI